SFSFFFNDTATTEIYTLSLHDALPISPWIPKRCRAKRMPQRPPPAPRRRLRSEEHTSELQSRQYLVCRLLLEKTLIGTMLSSVALTLPSARLSNHAIAVE